MPTGGGSAPTNPIAHAAALLEAVARDSGQSVDFDVPLHCGQAAGRLHTVLGYAPTQLPLVGDVAEDVRAAVEEAVTLLAGVPAGDLTEPVLDALLQARAAAAAVRARAVP
jgi:hypothetical protein